MMNQYGTRSTRTFGGVPDMASPKNEIAFNLEIRGGNNVDLSRIKTSSYQLHDSVTLENYDQQNIIETMQLVKHSSGNFNQL